jgi:hypothetical protein
MVLQNYIILEPGIPARMHFTDHVITRRTITDPVTGGGTPRNVLVFDVDKLNGLAVAAKYSTMSEKHALQFQPYLADKSYRDYDVVITVTGEGFRTSYSTQFIPRK